MGHLVVEPVFHVVHVVPVAVDVLAVVVVVVRWVAVHQCLDVRWDVDVLTAAAAVALVEVVRTVVLVAALVAVE